VIVVDAHVHLASSDRVRYPLAPGIGLNRWYDTVDASAEALLRQLDGAGVHAATVVQANAAYRHDNRYCLDAARVAPDRLVAVVAVDAGRADRAEVLERLADEGARGVRLLHVPRPDPSWIDDPATVDLWQVAVARGLRVQVQVVRSDLPAVARMLDWAPTVPIALDHAGIVDLSGPTTGEGALEPLLSLVPHRHVWFKISPHTLDVGRSAGLADEELVRRLADLVGAERLAWCSDWPNAGADYAALLARAARAAARLDDGERSLFLGGSVLERWPELAPRWVNGA
jgi:L-fuconolactonase